MTPLRLSKRQPLRTVLPSTSLTRAIEFHQDEVITNLSNLLLFLLPDCVSECIVIAFYDDQIVTSRVNDKFTRCVAQWSCHLVKNCSQLLKS